MTSIVILDTDIEYVPMRLIVLGTYQRRKRIQTSKENQTDWKNKKLSLVVHGLVNPSKRIISVGTCTTREEWYFTWIAQICRMPISQHKD